MLGSTLQQPEGNTIRKKSIVLETFALFAELNGSFASRRRHSLLAYSKRYDKHLLLFELLYTVSQKSPTFSVAILKHAYVNIDKIRRTNRRMT